MKQKSIFDYIFPVRARQFNKRLTFRDKLYQMSEYLKRIFQLGTFWLPSTRNAWPFSENCQRKIFLTKLEKHIKCVRASSIHSKCFCHHSILKQICFILVTHLCTKKTPSQSFIPLIWTSPMIISTIHAPKMLYKQITSRPTPKKTDGNFLSSFSTKMVIAHIKFAHGLCVCVCLHCRCLSSIYADRSHFAVDYNV